MALELSVNVLNKLERKNRHIRTFAHFEYEYEQMKSLIILQQPIDKHLKLGAKMMFSGLKKTGIAQNNGVKKREVSSIRNYTIQLFIHSEYAQISVCPLFEKSIGKSEQTKCIKSK